MAVSRGMEDEVKMMRNIGRKRKLEERGKCELGWRWSENSKNLWETRGKGM